MGEGLSRPLYVIYVVCHLKTSPWGMGVGFVPDFCLLGPAISTFCASVCLVTQGGKPVTPKETHREIHRGKPVIPKRHTVAEGR